VGADFSPVVESIWHMGDEGAGLGSDLAALDAEATIDAVGAVAVGAGEDGHGSADGDGDVEGGAAADERVADATHGVRAVGVSVGAAPGIVRGSCDWHFELELLVGGEEFVVGEGPVGSDAIAGVDLEVGGVEARGEGGPMDRASTNPSAAVVGAESEWVGAAGDARVFPVELVGSGFIADPVTLSIPEGAGFKANNGKAGAGEALEEDASGRADADDEVISLFIIVKAAHGDGDVLQRAERVLVRMRAVE